MRMQSALALVAAFLAIACRPQTARESEPVFDERFVPQARFDGRRDDPEWPAALRTFCNSRLPLERPAVCIRRIGGDSYGRGEAITAEIRWRNVPAGASAIVYLERDGPRGDRYLGAVGALMLTPIPLSGRGSMTFHWNGRQFPCAPTDFPTLCEQQAEIGRYRLRAALYDRRQIAIVGWPSRDRPTLLAHSLSTPFVVTGRPDLAPLARAMWWAAVNQRMRTSQLDHSGALAGDTNGSAVRVVERDGQLCGRIPANPPYVSTLESCIPKARLIGEAGLLAVPSEEIRVTGQVTVAAGAISRREAIALAQAVADRPYRSRVAFHRQPNPRQAGYDSQRDGDFHEWSRRNPRATTYLSDSVSETAFRPDLGGAWMIVVNEIMAGGSLPDDQRFADKVLVLVGPDGRACVLETVPYRDGTLSLDPRTARRSCGAEAPAGRSNP